MLLVLTSPLGVVWLDLNPSERPASKESSCFLRFRLAPSATVADPHQICCSDALWSDPSQTMSRWRLCRGEEEEGEVAVVELKKEEQQNEVWRRELWLQQGMWKVSTERSGSQSEMEHSLISLFFGGLQKMLHCTWRWRCSNNHGNLSLQFKQLTLQLCDLLQGFRVNRLWRTPSSSLSLSGVSHQLPTQSAVFLWG